MRHWLCVIIAALLNLTLAPVMANMAHAQQAMNCGPRDKMLADVKGKYKEKPDSAGLTSQGMLLEIWTSDSGTFTALMTTPQGISCVAAVGDGWVRKERPKGERGT